MIDNDILCKMRQAYHVYTLRISTTVPKAYFEIRKCQCKLEPISPI